MYEIVVHRGDGEADPFTEKWVQYLPQHGATVRRVNLMASDALDGLRGCHGVMWRFRHASTQKDVAWRLLTTVERYLDIPVFPDWSTAWHYDEKTAQYYLFKAIGVATPATWVFWEKREALDWAAGASYPVVYKMSHGASGDNVGIVRCRRQAERLIQLAFGPGVMPSDVRWLRSGGGPLGNLATRWRRWGGRVARETLDALGIGLGSPLGRAVKCARDYVYFQEFIPENSFDVRITVLGERAFAFRRFNREDDFRASGSGRIDYDTSKIDPRCIAIAFDVSRRLSLQSCGYDFLFREGEPLLSEISYTFHGATADCPGYFTPGGKWVARKMAPQEAQVEDFMVRVRRRFGAAASRREGG